MGFLRGGRKRPIPNAANEAAETMDTAEKAIDELTPEVIEALDAIDTIVSEAVETLAWIRTIKGWRRKIHWGNLFKPGKPFTSVELIFEEVK